MIHEYDMVTLTQDMPEYGLHAGDRGAIVLILEGDAGYMVEFDGPGDEPEVVPLCSNQFRVDSDELVTT